LEERKELKEGFKIIHQVKSITWINQTKSIQVSVNNGSLERDHFFLVYGLAAYV
jgi:hypothetical protein